MFLDRQRLSHSEVGMVSILVSMIMMIVITLVVLGFSQLSRTEVTQALNRQLTAEAFYAANSGINNAAAIIRTDIQKNQPPVAQTGSCTHIDGSAATTYNNTQKLSPTNNVAYTCVTVNPYPTTVERQIPKGSYYAFPLQLKNGTAVSSITFSWYDQAKLSGPLSCPSVGTFPPSANWGNCPGLLQVDIVSADNTTSISSLQNGTLDFFLYPNGASSNGSPVANGTVYGVPCDSTTGTCSLTLSTPAATTYYVRIAAIYQDVYFIGSIPGNKQLQGAQAAIDVTGRAQDVLQRLNARVPLTNLGGVPFAIQTNDSICKRLEGYPGNPGYTAIGSPGTNCPSPAP